MVVEVLVKEDGADNVAGSTREDEGRVRGLSWLEGRLQKLRKTSMNGLHFPDRKEGRWSQRGGAGLREAWGGNLNVPPDVQGHLSTNPLSVQGPAPGAGLPSGCAPPCLSSPSQSSAAS